MVLHRKQLAYHHHIKDYRSAEVLYCIHFVFNITQAIYIASSPYSRRYIGDIPNAGETSMHTEIARVSSQPSALSLGVTQCGGSSLHIN